MELAFFFGRAGRRGERAEDCAGAGVVLVVSSVAHQRATGEVGLVAPAYISVAFSCTTSSVRQALLYDKLCTPRLDGFDWRWNPLFPH